VKAIESHECGVSLPQRAKAGEILAALPKPEETVTSSAMLSLPCHPERSRRFGDGVVEGSRRCLPCHADSGSFLKSFLPFTPATETPS
jgi:hypothetical protein